MFTVKPSEKFEDLINEIAFEILDHDIDEIGEYDSLRKIIADKFDEQLGEEE